MRHTTMEGPGPAVMSAGTLIGDKVRNREGEDLGEIEEIMLDTYSGRIGYAVLSFGGVMGIGEKLFAIPWSSLEIDTEDNCFVLDIDKERLKNAPGFDKDNWPDMANPEWGSEVHEYYSRPFYWEH